MGPGGAARAAGARRRPGVQPRTGATSRLGIGPNDLAERYPQLIGVEISGYGKGRQIEISMFDVVAELMGYPLTWTRYTGTDQQPVGMASPAVAPYGAYPTSDGRVVVLGTTNDNEWQRLTRQLLGRDDLAANPRYARNDDPLRSSTTRTWRPGTASARSRPRSARSSDCCRR